MESPKNNITGKKSYLNREEHGDNFRPAKSNQSKNRVVKIDVTTP
jgi:hypothetical protein